MSEAGKELYKQLSGQEFQNYDAVRHDPFLVQVVEQLGEKANGRHAKLAIHNITSNKYKIDEYNGAESVVVPEEIDWVVIH